METEPADEVGFRYHTGCGIFQQIREHSHFLFYHLSHMAGSLQIVIGTCTGFKYLKQIQKRISGLEVIIKERSLTIFLCQQALILWRKIMDQNT